MLNSCLLLLKQPECQVYEYMSKIIESKYDQWLVSYRFGRNNTLGKNRRFLVFRSKIGFVLFIKKKKSKTWTWEVMPLMLQLKPSRWKKTIKLFFFFKLWLENTHAEECLDISLDNSLVKKLCPKSILHQKHRQPQRLIQQWPTETRQRERGSMKWGFCCCQASWWEFCSSCGWSSYQALYSQLLMTLPR